MKSKLLIIPFFLSFFVSLAQDPDDCKLLNSMVAQYKVAYKKSFFETNEDKNVNLDSLFIEDFFLSKYNDNNDIDQYFEELKEREQAGHFMHLDSLRKKINDPNHLFSEKNKEFFLTQVTQKNSLWSQTPCKPNILTKELNRWKLGQYSLFVSKPVYTSDKRYAIIFVTIRGLSVIHILYNNPETDWIEADSDIIGFQ